MAWITVKGLAGKVYQPETSVNVKKRHCGDCFSCQNCSKERCRLCCAGQRQPVQCPVASGSDKEVNS
jgi:hypothetical protein